MTITVAVCPTAARRSVLACVVALSGFLAVASAHAEECVSMGANQYVNVLRICVSSALPDQGAYSYGPENLVSGPDGWAWCEGQDGPGEGGRLTLSWAPADLSWRTLLIANGYQRTEQTFQANGRIRDLRVRLEDGSRLDIRLEDQMGTQIVQLPDWTHSAVTDLTILSVYPGARYEDTCLTALGVDMEEADLEASPFDP
ncbi:NADase-type glycan-binding domain-containing protein [Rhodospira trueperi]|uniref:NAD glycohydrolase translocation F5/8 type C domain-containing protein n=1 Tax=Rhodospira trueperi TaxID=69960 RepID=A0A1G7G6P2_9PROT|nr:hypothetical protein [Rhodospira trueperi]SDE83806.1 hypothetical protein SAMN05421720_113113 [Rhodospira trueperi]